MMYVVGIEARCYGDPDVDWMALLDALEGVDADLRPNVSPGENQMLLAQLQVDASDGRDAHDAALEVYDEAWETAFPGMAPGPVLVIKCLPGQMAGQAAGRAEEDDAAELAEADDDDA